MNGLASRSVLRDQQVLSNIVQRMDAILNSEDDFGNYKNFSEEIAQCLEAFNKVRKAHKRIRFDYTDVLRGELSKYSRGYVPSICVLNGQIFITPFNKLKEACNIVIKNNSTKLAYPDDLKIGNEAIGQAWLTDCTEVFSPRHALKHSIISTAHMLKRWANSFKERMETRRW